MRDALKAPPVAMVQVEEIVHYHGFRRVLEKAGEDAIRFHAYVDKAVEALERRLKSR